jgi:hypothetical protein
MASIKLAANSLFRPCGRALAHSTKALTTALTFGGTPAASMGKSVPEAWMGFARAAL